jgi:transcriptional regulator with PAS, ATPase and Fis domain
MNFVWLKPLSGETSNFPLHQREIIEANYDDDFSTVTRGDRRAVIIIEINDASSVERAIELVEEHHKTYPVWVYQPAATVQSTVLFMKAGACHVMGGSDELEQAMLSAREIVDSEAPAGKVLLGKSRSIQAAVSSVNLVANRNCNVLIEGETGTGKEIVAQQIHRSGNRVRGPWVAVNCGAIPDSLLEAELFGHVRGAFTGAVQARAGKFEAANHGSIFLDEIGEMPFAVQAKLLRVLQEKEIERLGGNERIRLDVRVIAATNANLEQKVREGHFRQDLYYRLNVFRIMLPPLRERASDIPDLANHFIAKICRNENIRPKTLDTSALDRLMEHVWPGNARELENVMETAIIFSGTRACIFASDLRIDAPGSQLKPSPPNFASTLLPSAGLNYQQALDAFEHDLLTQALTRTRGNKTAAADLLRLKRTTLSARVRVLDSRLPRLVA